MNLGCRSLILTLIGALNLPSRAFNIKLISILVTNNSTCEPLISVAFLKFQQLYKWHIQYDHLQMVRYEVMSKNQAQTQTHHQQNTLSGLTCHLDIKLSHRSDKNWNLVAEPQNVT